MSLFHAGGAINNFPPADGIGILKSIITRLQHLDYTKLGSLVALASVIPPAWRYIRHAWHETGSWIRHFFVSSVTIAANDQCNRNVTTWLLENVVEPKRMRFFTARTQVSSRDLEPGAALKKSTRAVQYIPHWRSTFFWHESRLFMVSRSLESLNASLSDPTYDGVGGEEITISCFGLSADPIRHLIETCREFADQKTQYFVIIYSRDRYGMSWRPKYRQPLRRLDTVHFDEKVKQNLIADIRNYLDPRTQRLYQSRSMPYRRGYLLHGPPGTGKSSLSVALAGEFGLDLYEVKVPMLSDADLEQAFQEIPPRCIVLLEDIDCVWSRDQQVERHHDTDSNSNGSSVPNVTLSGLLNVLDGVGSQEGRVVIMTTNKAEKLDGALVRPGRVDLKIHLGYISAVCAEEMFMRMFSPELLSWAARTTTLEQDAQHDPLDQYVSIEQVRMLAAKFSRSIPENTITPSQLQGFFQMHLSSAVEAASSIEAWVEKEQSSRVI